MDSNKRQNLMEVLFLIKLWNHLAYKSRTATLSAFLHWAALSQLPLKTDLGASARRSKAVQLSQQIWSDLRHQFPFCQMHQFHWSHRCPAGAGSSIPIRFTIVSIGRCICIGTGTITISCTFLLGVAILGRTWRLLRSRVLLLLDIDINFLSSLKVEERKRSANRYVPQIICEQSLLHYKGERLNRKCILLQWQSVFSGSVGITNSSPPLQ